MTSIEHWQKLVIEYPSLRSDKNRITMEVQWLHTQITLAHAAGCDYMKARRQAEGISSILDSIFDSKKDKR